MNIETLGVTQQQALVALREYKQHRSVYDKRDWEIERIYRQISKGKAVISAIEAVRLAGLDQKGWPKLALMRADQQVCRCEAYSGWRILRATGTWSKAAEWYFKIPFPGAPWMSEDAIARLPRIPPQHRPPQARLANYHILWEADWVGIPRDPYLLRRIGKDAWVVCAAWDLTDVEVAVMRAHQ